MEVDNQHLLISIKEIIISARKSVFRMANNALLETYWQIGKLIIGDEQQGNAKAEYDKGTLKNLAKPLTLEFGSGFDERNLNNMKAFYKASPIWNALHTKLSWTHYRIISRLETEHKRNYYLNESIAGNWNNNVI
jgi:hypothetical protein